LARFSGVRNFDPHGFNRNAFGSMAGWNAWGNNYWGAGWNDWGTGWGYWAGPIFWPFFYGDVLTFALWPYAFYDPFFASGADLLLTSIFWPGPLFSPYYAYNPYNTYYPYYGEGSLFNIYGYAPHANGYVSYGYYGDRPHHYRHHRLYASRSAAHANLGAECPPSIRGGWHRRMGNCVQPSGRSCRLEGVRDFNHIVFNRLQAGFQRGISDSSDACAEGAP